MYIGHMTKVISINLKSVNKITEGWNNPNHNGIPWMGLQCSRVQLPGIMKFSPHNCVLQAIRCIKDWDQSLSSWILDYFAVV